MKLRFLKGRFRGRLVELNEDGFCVGRDEDSDLCLDEEGISRQHCKLYKVGDDWFVQDLGSTNGVRVNGEHIGDRSYQLKVGDRVGLYNQLLLFTDDRDIVDVGALPVPGTAAEGAAGQPLVETAVAGGEAVTPESEGAAPSAARPSGAGPVPWGRVLILLIVAAVLGWFAYITFVVPPASDSETDGAASAQRSKDGGEGTVGAEAGEGTTSGAQTAAVEWDEAPIEEAPREGDLAVPEPPRERDPRPDDPGAAGEPAGGQGAPTAVDVVIETEPPGASISIDGRDHGATPAVVRGLAPGRHMLSLSLEGYEELVRQIYNPGMLPDRPYELRLKAGAILVRSTPAGAAVVHGSQLLGHTPLLLENLPAGRHELRLISYGCEPVRQMVTVDDVRGQGLDVILVAPLGGLEIVTLPAGCEVSIDDTLKGVTRQAADTARNQSDPFRVTGLKEGEHLVRVEHPNGGSKVERAVVKRGQIVTVPVRLWVLDTKVVLTDGTVKHGMRVSTNEFGDVILAEPKTNRYLKEQIKEITPLTPEEAQALRRERGGDAAEME